MIIFLIFTVEMKGKCRKVLNLSFHFFRILPNFADHSYQYRSYKFMFTKKRIHNLQKAITMKEGRGRNMAEIGGF